jgi:hypothetical protein
MLNNAQFTELERRLWREGNPLCDELVSTRDTLLSLIKEAQGVMEHYKPVLDSLSDAKDLEFYRLWDNFGDTLDNLDYELGN